MDAQYGPPHLLYRHLVNGSNNYFTLSSNLVIEDRTRAVSNFLSDRVYKSVFGTI